MRRYLTSQVEKDLKRKMVFIGGPRQVGKTTLAKQLLRKQTGYLNWDVAADRSRILEGRLPTSSLLVFDEVHKYRKWRNYMKGLYDSKPAEQRILVTGSARLDYYRFGGDSLQGRYHYLRLHPLSVAEIGMRTSAEFAQLLKLGGFPEPFLSGSETEAKRWSREYRSRLVREEISSVEQVIDLGSLELLVARLPALVGSPLSINALSEDLQISHKTIAKWIKILERTYAVFRLAPFGSPRIRAVKKEQKHYHFDWSVVKDPGARFENLVACHLLKWVNFQEDTAGREIELRYFRDIEGREVDFVVVEDGIPLWAIECKSTNREISKNLRYFKAKFPLCLTFQLSASGREDFTTPDGIRVCSAAKILGEMLV